MADAVRIGIFGEFDPASPTLPWVEKSLQHAAQQLKISVDPKWLPTDSLLDRELGVAPSPAILALIRDLFGQRPAETRPLVLSG